MLSKVEEKVMKIIGRRKMKIGAVTEAFYDGIIPPGGQNRIAGVIRSINIKSDYYNLNWKVDGEGAGRNGRTVWRKSL